MDYSIISFQKNVIRQNIIDRADILKLSAYDDMKSVLFLCEMGCSEKYLIPAILNKLHTARKLINNAIDDIQNEIKFIEEKIKSSASRHEDDGVGK